MPLIDVFDDFNVASPVETKSPRHFNSAIAGVALNLNLHGLKISFFARMSGTRLNAYTGVPDIA
jgi:hypothetical protein